MTDDIITFSEAIRIYRAITGRKICRKYLEEQLRRFRHLGYFALVGVCSDPKLTGVRRHAWEYFVRARLALSGSRQVFHDEGEEL